MTARRDPDTAAALASAANLKDRIDEWKRLRCRDAACCSPATLGLGLHAINQLRREHGLHEVRSHWSIHTTQNVQE